LTKDALLTDQPFTPFGRANPNDPVRQMQNGGPQAGQTIFQNASTVEPASLNTKRSRFARNRLVVFSHFVLSLIVIAAIVAGATAYYGKLQFEKPGPLAANKLFVVERNSNLRDISVRLFTEGLISDERVFQMAVRATGNGAKLKAGEYEVAAGASMRDVMNTITSGRSVEYSVTIPEGLTVQQAWARIASNASLTGEMPAQMPGEGLLIADTHSFPRGTDRTEVVNKLIDLQTALVNQVWQKRNPDVPVQNINEFITLASIVEKETGIAEERPRVASVFVNRLRQGMRLQSDPTIVYGIFGGAGKPADRPIYKSDIEKPTPYNTYAIDGLPVGPIAIPGRAALEAVANPLVTKDLFFVADGTGGHVFAETLDEHNANVVKWRQIEKQREEAAKKVNSTNP
jgi:UPF0755 protein